MKSVSLYDFQGGYATSVPSPLLSPNELLRAENCHWDNGLVKRKGYTKYTADDATFDAGMVVGIIRTGISGLMEAIYAVNTSGTGVTFWTGNETPVPLAGFTLNESTDVRMVQLGDYVVGVTGSDYPFAIWYDGGYQIDYVQTIDTRVRHIQEWHVVQFDSVPEYTNITANVQDATTTTALTTGVAGEGFIVSCDYTFNKIDFSGLTAAGAVTATYEYSDGSGWTLFTPTTEPDWENGGDGVLEFDIPMSNGEMNWTPFSGVVDFATERFAIRITFSAHTAINGDALAVSMNQYLRLITGDEYPTDICVHNSRIQIASGRAVNFSPVNLITGWRSDEVEYFGDGGTSIQKMVSFPNALVVFKEDAIYALTGNSYQTYAKRKASPHGTIAPHSVVPMGQEVYYLARDGIRGWNGTISAILTKHIADEIPFDTNAVAADFAGHYFISFPGSGVTLRFDPDTARRRTNGDPVVSFFKYTNYGFTRLIYASQNRDSGYFFGVKDGSPGVYRLQHGDTDDGTNVTMYVTTLRYTFSAPGTKKRMGRIKPEVIPAGDYTIGFEADDGLRTASMTLASGTTGSVYTEDISLPYTLDGKNVAFTLEHGGVGGGLRAIHIGQHRRKY